VELPLGVSRALYWLGVLLMILAIVDALLPRVAHIDLTGKYWSPLVFGGIGILLMRLCSGRTPSSADTD
jgi:hypothetical protein